MDTINQLLQLTTSHTKAITAIRDNVVPAVRSLRDNEASTLQRIGELEGQVNVLTEAVNNLTALVQGVSEQLAQAQQAIVPAPVVPIQEVEFDASSFDLGDFGVAQEQPQVQQAPVQQPQVQQTPEEGVEQSGNAPLCRADIPLPNPATYVKENRVRANRADYFLAWDYKLANPTAKQADIAEYLGISRQSVSKYMNMTAEELNELPNYRSDDMMVGGNQVVNQVVTPQVQEVPQVQPQVVTPQVQEVPQVQPQVEPMVNQQAPAQDYPASVDDISNSISEMLDAL